MVNLSKIEEPTICFSLLIFLFLHLFTIPVTSYTPVDYFAVNCGFSGNSYSGSDGRKWKPDVDSNLFSFIENDHSSVTAHAAQDSPPFDKALYTTARLSRSEFTYSFQVTDGQKFVRLFFYPASYSGFDRSNSLFSVKAGHYTLLNDFNASLTADDNDDPAKRLSREYCVNVEPGHRLNITFSPGTTHPEAYAFINGIEIVSMPTHLYYTKPDDRGFKRVDQDRQFRVDNDSALEMVYRINVGGDEIQPDQDTGLFRYWDDDTGYDYLVMPNPQKAEAAFNSKVRYQDDIQNYIAPEQVYLTAQTSKYNLTWEFEVDSRFIYMIRLHFCEFDQNVQQAGDRVFQIFIADTLAEPHADVLNWTSSSLIPHYKDYAVLLNQRSLKKLNLSIKLQTDPTSKYDVVILNGIEIFKVSDSSDNLGGPNPDTSSSSIKPSKNPEKKTKTPIVIAVVACAALGVIVISVISFLIFRRRTKAPVNRTIRKSSDLCRHFSIAEIRAATDNFDDHLIIGVGGFGNVYKGYIDKGNASTPVAIKRLKPESDQGVDEFQTEIRMLSQFRHPNLVPLIGYCNDGNEMILVYDHMARGTLRDHLHGSKNQPLSWKQRLEICVGAARGLEYLHKNTGENKQSVIHRDVKSTNILLDEDWVAKVSDFGLSKIGPTGLSRSHITTDVKGSFGYMDPEYSMSLRLTQKSDVYSFGVVLLEVLCGRPPLLQRVEKQQDTFLVEWVRKSYDKGEIDKVIDPVLKGIITSQCLNKFVQMALSCLNADGKRRPSMKDVVRGLEFVLQMQGRMEGGALTEGKAKSEDTIMLTRIKSDEESDVQFSTSDGSQTESKSSSKVTVNSEEEQALVSKAVFSELANPTAR